MRSFLFAALVLSSTAYAGVLKCPDRYPTKNITVSDESSNRKIIGRIQGTSLSNAYMVSGELYAQQEMVPDIRKVKGGLDIGFNFLHDQKWLVCVYGGNELSPKDQATSGTIDRWEQIDPKFSECVVQLRETKAVGYPSVWTATAVCK
ncbi:STY0301 family protein [Massilia horti]|uniref:Uncharacterized protein n=1 Tax=Massilia horti TaxID=2562153 RepID=A0A4Y9T5M7_9BURK|nr:STY0301 family protein [Massilia horti]TFW35988.1 hypothetical protein E4O92_00740 [Massilia horti]